jgi:hypothetical protein
MGIKIGEENTGPKTSEVAVQKSKKHQTDKKAN